jgi:lysophospholipase L1-like esterase
MTSSPQKLRRLRWLTLLGSVALSLLAAELFFRVFWVKRLVLDAGIEDPHVHHRLKPNTDYDFSSGEFRVRVRTNRYGLRGPDPVIPPPPETVRILVMGDSYTFGFPVEDQETFAKRMESLLKAQGYPVEIVNGGASGYSTTLHYISLRDQFLSFQPDLVILWFDLSDVQEDAWYQKNLIYDETGRIVRCDPRYVNGRYDWWGLATRHSALAKYINTKILRTVHKIQTLGLKAYLAAKLRGERSKVAIARLKAAQQSDDLAAYDTFLMVRESSTPERMAPYWSLTERHLLLIRDLLAEREIPLLLGLYPYGMLAGPDQWGDGRVYWGFEKGRTYEAPAAHALFADFSKRSGVPLLNMFEPFRQAAKTETLFYNWDGHFTPAGHRVLAEAAVRDPALVSTLQQLVRRRGRMLGRVEGRRGP